MKNRKRFSLPVDHQPAIRVPVGGSSCATCVYAQELADGPHCVSKHYRRYMGTTHLIDPDTGARVLDATAYCSDWYEPSTMLP